MKKKKIKSPVDFDRRILKMDEEEVQSLLHMRRKGASLTKNKKKVLPRKQKHKSDF